MKYIFLSTLLASMSFANAADSYPVDEAKVRAALESKLKDSESARFRNLAANNDGGPIINLCGDVNSKNSYGAYAGYEKFYGAIAPRPNNGDIYIILGIGGAASKMCQSLGL